MNTFQSLQAAATASQSILAQMQGFDPTSQSGNFTLEGDETNYLGVMQEVTAQMPARGGGFESVRALSINATSNQFSQMPDASKRQMVSAWGQTWKLTAVGKNALSYTLTCVFVS